MVTSLLNTTNLNVNDTSINMGESSFKIVLGVDYLVFILNLEAFYKLISCFWNALSCYSFYITAGKAKIRFPNLIFSNPISYCFSIDALLTMDFYLFYGIINYLDPVSNNFKDKLLSEYCLIANYYF